MDNKVTKRPPGRPTLYNEESIIIQAEQYLATCGREQTKLPKLTEFYRLIGINRDTGNEWQDIHPTFSDICKKIMDYQQEQLIDDGMYGGKEVNPGMAVFLLKAKHGLKDGTGQTNVQVNVTPILSELKAE